MIPRLGISKRHCKISYQSSNIFFKVAEIGVRKHLSPGWLMERLPFLLFAE
jgi:hypothetical protein